MGKKTGIQWTDATWNPLRGCSKVSAGCANCYAERVAARFSKPGQPYAGLAEWRGVGDARAPRWTGKLQLVEEHLRDPLRWQKPRRVFVNSMSDLFHESVPDEWIDRIFAVMALSRRHIFQVLTKRPDRMQAWTERLRGHRTVAPVSLASAEFDPNGQYFVTIGEGGCYLPNVWLGVSVEDQAAANARIPALLNTPAAVRYLSAEPLLGPIDLMQIERPDRFHRQPYGWRAWLSKKLHWVILGGESGPGARACETGNLRDLLQQARSMGVACFVKQLGENPLEVRLGAPLSATDAGILEADGWSRLFLDGAEYWQRKMTLASKKGADPAEWPEDLRVREMPEGHVPQPKPQNQEN